MKGLASSWQANLGFVDALPSGLLSSVPAQGSQRRDASKMMDEEVLNGNDGEVAAEDVDQNGEAAASPGKKASPAPNGTEALGAASAERIKIKGKRNVRSLPKEVTAGPGGVVHSVRKWKNSRRSRNGLGRGAPKKGKEGPDGC